MTIYEFEDENNEENNDVRMFKTKGQWSLEWSLLVDKLIRRDFSESFIEYDRSRLYARGK